MRIKPILLSMLAGVAFVGCTSGDDVDPNGGGTGDGTTSYLAVNLISSDRTRAAIDGFEDGDPKENKVTSVRFYFFDAAGGSASVKLKNGEYVNFYDWETPTQKPDGVKDDIESLLSATIIINTGNEDKIPAMVAAVVNPTIKDDNSRSLTDLKGLVEDYAKPDLTREGNFVMFNSVYRNGSAEVSTTAIKPENLQDSEDKALAHPVKIYVERNVAKVSVELDDKVGFDDNGKLALKTKDSDGNEVPLTIDGKQVYLEILGWDLAAETNHGRLVKKINPGWPIDNLFGTYRSYWAINSMRDDLRNLYDKSYNDIKTSPAFLYTNENARKEDIDATQCKAPNDTKVILAGKLTDVDGNPLNIVRHVGAHFIDDANYTQLRTNILNQLSIYRKYYYDTKVEVEVGGETQTVTQRRQIGIDDIRIVNTETVEDENSDNNCYVYAQLTDAAAARTWYTSLDQDAQPMADAAKTINADLANKEIVSWPLVWNGGKTYYYYSIKHLEGLTGVVRNHVYKTRVTKILGLGTPVYNPADIIYPEKPDENDHFIAAEVKILSWRIVSNDYTLEW